MGAVGASLVSLRLSADDRREHSYSMRATDLSRQLGERSPPDWSSRWTTEEDKSSITTKPSTSLVPMGSKRSVLVAICAGSCIFKTSHTVSFSLAVQATKIESHLCTGPFSRVGVQNLGLWPTNTGWRRSPRDCRHCRMGQVRAPANEERREERSLNKIKASKTTACNQSLRRSTLSPEDNSPEDNSLYSIAEVCGPCPYQLQHFDCFQN